MEDRLEVIVYNCNGLTGKLICDYIWKCYPRVKFGMAGESLIELEEVRSDLKVPSHYPIFGISLSDKNGIEAMTSQTKVLINASGSYKNDGCLLIEACLSTQTNYCDISSDIPFIKKVIDTYHEEAKAKKVKIINACGFLSVPADLGVQMMLEEAKKREIEVSQIMLLSENVRGSISAGTMSSIIETYESLSLWDFIKLFNPYYLNPIDEQSKSPIIPYNDSKLYAKACDNVLFNYDFKFKFWSSPLVTQFIDARIIHRSNALQNWTYGKHFIFFERNKVNSFILAVIFAVIQIIFHFFLLFPLSRKFLKVILPKVGKGPIQDILDNGYFNLKLLTKGVNSEGNNVFLVGSISGSEGDPGYKQTAKIISEAALCLSQETKQLPNDFGVLTPACGLGKHFRQRLEHHGIHFKVTYSGIR